MKKACLLLLVGAMILVLATIVGGCASKGVAPLSAKNRFRVATTTSLYDTGLWGYLEPRFENKYDVEMDIMYAGTGKAIEFGQRGDVDAITVHSKSREEQFIADGYGVERFPIAYNYFLIIGPESDPAGVKGLSPEDGFKQLMEKGQAVWRVPDDEVTFRWNIKDNEIWLSTKSGGIIIGTIQDKTIRVKLPGAKTVCNFEKMPIE